MDPLIQKLAIIACIAVPPAFAQSQGTIYFTTNPGTVGAPLTSTVSGSTGAAEFALGSASYEATAVSGGGAVLAGYTLSPGGPAAMVGGTVVSAASDGFVVGSSTVPYVSGSGGSLVTAMSSPTYTDGETSIASVMSESSGSGNGASPSTTGSSSDAAGAVLKATGSWQGAAVALGGLVGVAALL